MARETFALVARSPARRYAWKTAGSKSRSLFTPPRRSSFGSRQLKRFQSLRKVSNVSTRDRKSLRFGIRISPKKNRGSGAWYGESKRFQGSKPEFRPESKRRALLLLALFANQQILRKRPFLIDPLPIAPESRPLRHGNHIGGLVLVRTLRPDRFAFFESYFPSFRRWDGHAL